MYIFSTVPTTMSSSVTPPSSDIPDQTTEEDSNDETTTNVYVNDTNLIGIPDGHDGMNFSSQNFITKHNFLHVYHSGPKNLKSPGKKTREIK